MLVKMYPSCVVPTALLGKGWAVRSRSWGTCLCLYFLKCLEGNDQAQLQGSGKLSPLKPHVSSSTLSWVGLFFS